MSEVPGQNNSGKQASTNDSGTSVQHSFNPLIVLGVIVFYGVGGLLLAAVFGNQWAQAILAEISEIAWQHPYWTLGGCVLLIVIAYVFWWFTQRIRELPENSRRTLMGFLAVGLILLGTTAIMFLATYRLFAEQVALFLVASLLPGSLYYLFLRTRRPSILNEFTMNLWRFGLLVHRHTYLRQGIEVVERIESQEELMSRVDSYFQKFEAVYGVLRFDHSPGDPTVSRTSYVEAILQSGNGSDMRRRVQPTVRLADILTANIFIPLGFATFLSALGWLLVLEPHWVAVNVSPIPVTAGGGTTQAATEVVKILGPIATPLNFAFLGAYFFGLQTLFRRFVRRDLGPNAFLAFSNRILLSVIGVWVIVVCFAVFGNSKIDDLLSATTSPKGHGLLVVAFILGVFPRTLWQVITGALTKWSLVKLAVPSVDAKQPLDHLDGLTIWHESRLEEEDIENVPNMATADMVDLVLHTQIPAERLVDWIDQAILYKNLGPESETDFAKTRRGRLRAWGIRTATQLVRIYTNADETKRRQLDQSLGDDQSRGLIWTIVQAIQLESNWDCIAAWRNVEGPAINLP